MLPRRPETEKEPALEGKCQLMMDTLILCFCLTIFLWHSNKCQNPVMSPSQRAVLRSSQWMIACSLAAPQLHLQTPRARWHPLLWAQCWTLCCSYRGDWCCCHCRRILFGKAGREICAKTRRQATLHRWTESEDQHTEIWMGCGADTLWITHTYTIKDR